MGEQKDEITIDGVVYVRKDVKKETPKVPPNGWPVLARVSESQPWSIQVSMGELVTERAFDLGNLVCRHDFDNGMCGSMTFAHWKPYTLPDGRELSPENFGKGGHKVSMRKIDGMIENYYSVMVDGVTGWRMRPKFAMMIAGGKFNTIGNEWVEV